MPNAAEITPTQFVSGSSHPVWINVKFGDIVFDVVHSRLIVGSRCKISEKQSPPNAQPLIAMRSIVS